MAFIFRLYWPMTNRPSHASTFSIHSPRAGKRIGNDGCTRGARVNTLTKPTTGPGRRDGAMIAFDIRRTISRPSHITIFVAKGNRCASSARTCLRVTGRWNTKVPAAPMLTAPRCLSAFARTAGRMVRCPPTFTPLSSTTSRLVDLIVQRERMVHAMPDGRTPRASKVAQRSGRGTLNHGIQLRRNAALEHARALKNKAAGLAGDLADDPLESHEGGRPVAPVHHQVLDVPLSRD